MLHRIISFVFLGLAIFLFSCSTQPAKTNGGEEVKDTSTTNFSETEETSPPEDKSKRPSPPQHIEMNLGENSISLDYSSPSVKGRKIWGDLVPYDQIWRTGANEANLFVASQDILVNGNMLKAGKYALFTLPTANEWTVIFNTQFDQWGAYSYDAHKDALRIPVSTQNLEDSAEMMEFTLTEAEESAMLNFRWEHLGFSISLANAN